MSFLSHGLKAIIAGDDAADVIKSLIDQVQEARRSEDVGLLEAIKEVVDSDDDVKNLGEVLIEWARENSSEELSLLFTQLSEVEKLDEDTKRSIGWPSESWTKSHDGGDVDFSYGFDLEVNGGFSFDIYKDGITEIENLNTIEGFEALAKISALGQLKGGVKGSMNLPVGGAKVSADGGISRSLEYVFGYESHDQLTGLAFASAMRQLKDPSDGQQIHSVFTNPKAAKLHGILIEGDQSLGGKADVSARIPTQYGDFKIDLGGEIKTSSTFDYVITHEELDTLSILVNSNRSRSNSASLGVSYVVGLSTIAPGAAHKLLEKVQGVHEHIVKLDKEINESLDDFEKIKNTWLKPGTLIQEKINEKLGDLLNNPDLPKSVISSLGKLFGVDVKDSGEFFDLIKSQLTEVVAKLIDDMPDVFNLESEDISQKIVDAIKGSVDAKVIALLDRDVLGELKGMIDEKVTELAKRLDNDVNDGLKSVLDISLDELPANIKKFLDKARSISQTILDKVTQAQTDLLSAEIGWRRAVSKAVGYDYKVTFKGMNDNDNNDGLAFYKKAVISPRSFGEIIFTKTLNLNEYIMVEDASARYALTENKGFRWNIALLGLSFGGAANKLSDVSIHQTTDGVNIITKGQVTKERSFWNETRRVSFVSAMNLYEANVKNKDGELDPRSTATIKLSFEEEDEKLKLEEAKNLLKGFVEHGLLSGNVKDNILQALLKIHQTVDKKHVYATITVGVAIPSDVVITMLEKVSDHTGVGLMGGQGFFRNEIINSLATHDTEWVDEMNMQSTPMVGLGISGGSSDFDNLTEDEKFLRRIDFLKNAVDTHAHLHDEGLGVRHSRHHDRLRNRRNRDRTMSSEEHAADAIIAFEKVLDIGADVCFNLERPDADSESIEWRRIESILREKQKQMNKYAKKYLKTGSPVWASKAPGKTMALFAAFKNVTNKLTQVTPPLLITLKPKNGEPVSFVDFSGD
ncbi:hypothetical protein OS175_04195 [Marinicella sp. S1101]|uniref:hypothetical protein n=1 Tax=Marinicella marina TaxID=2996016 RepID=UPI002260FBF0|nr:hypothetical protein [Marinicella marina]MCX7553068.1 hypothetical protein [Marinicella marina]